MSNKKLKNNSKTEYEDCQKKLKNMSLKYREVKKRLRSAERDLASIQKDIRVGKLIPYEGLDEFEPEEEEIVQEDVILDCPDCGHKGLSITYFNIRDKLVELRVCPECGYRKTKKTNSPTL